MLEAVNRGGNSLPVSSLVINGGKGSTFTFTSITELITIAASATTSSATNLIPANSRIIGIAYRVTTVIPTAATFQIGLTGDPTLFGSGISTAANTTGTTFASAVLLAEMMNGAALTILVTPNLTPAAATGRLRVVTYYETIVAPTS